MRGSQALIGFTTRRDPVAPNQYGTHPWVTQELGVADAQDPPIPWVEVREEGVASPGGILDAVNSQRIHYREQDRAVCLVQITLPLDPPDCLCGVAARSEVLFNDNSGFGKSAREQQPGPSDSAQGAIETVLAIPGERPGPRRRTAAPRGPYRPA